MPKTRKSLKMALALLLSASAGTLAIATPASAQQAQDIQRYANSGYNYCDAKLIGALYQRDPYQGKLIIGSKVRNGIVSNIPVLLRESRAEGNRCDWADLGLSYNDAAALGNYWGVSVGQAKAKAASYFTNARSGVVTDALRYGARIQQNEDRASMEAFGRSGFTYCDAKLISGLFNESVGRGKIKIGMLINAGAITDIDGRIEESRGMGNRCTWSDMSYSYDDAVRLARMWKKSVVETKDIIVGLVENGRSGVVDGSLGR